MSGTHAHTVPFVAETRYADAKPPTTETGVLAWLRENLFSSWFNTLLTVLSIGLLIWIVPPFLDWALFKSVWNAGSLSECRSIIVASFGEGSHGACWAVINERFGQLLYGFYPVDQRWRPNMALLLLVTALAPVLFRTLLPLAFGLSLLLIVKVAIELGGWLASNPVAILFGPNTLVSLIIVALALLAGGERQRKYWIWFSLAYPVVAFVLLLGGLGLPAVDTDRFGGMLLTMVIGVTGITASLPLGILLALGRRSKLPVLNVISVAFIEFVRGVPLITLLFVASTLLNYFLPPGTEFDIVLRVIILATLFATAYMAEVVRGGLAALPRGQYEAADSMGLSYWQSMRLIILPQALKISIPGIVNTFIGLFKDTTLVSIIGLFDPLGLTKPILADSNWQGIVWELYGFIALMFFICCLAMSRYSMYLEQRLAAGEER